MKKTLLSIFAIAGFSALASAQVEMYVDGGTTDYAGGGVHTHYASGDVEQVLEIHVENHSGTDQEWFVSRTRINRPISWTDFLCYGHQSNSFGGLCYDGSSMDTDNWSMGVSGAIQLADDEYSFISIHIVPSFDDPAVVTYRYYIGDSQNAYIDSMDVEVILTPLSIEDIAPSLSVNVAPNPASDYVKVTADGVNDATVRIMDVLGNLILTKEIKGSKTFDVSEYRSGIYFVIVESNGVKTVNRKVIIRH